jgi:hypothetical protein
MASGISAVRARSLNPLFPGLFSRCRVGPAQNRQAFSAASHAASLTFEMEAEG